MAKAIHAVVIDDNKDDLFIATRLLARTGIKDITQFSGIPEAIVFLEDIAEGIRPCPDLIVLDLNVGHDSGFEVLRHYKANAKLHDCDIIVWAGSGAIEKELCEHFGVDCVPKSKGDAALAHAIGEHLKIKSTKSHGADD